MTIIWLSRYKIMFIGSSEEYVASEKTMNEEAPLDANNPYGISKITQGLPHCTDSNMACRFIALNLLTIPVWDSFVFPSFCKQVEEIEKSGKSGIIKVGNLVAKRDFSHVKDIVRAYRLILESEDDTQIYNVGSGRAFGLD